MMRSNLWLLFSCILAVGATLTGCGNDQSTPTTKPPAVLAPSSQATPVMPFVSIDAKTFKAKMQDPNTVVLDVRTPAETQLGIIDGAITIDITQGDFMQKVNQLDKSKTYLVYCKVGGRSSTACEMMAEAGFKNLFNLAGGYVTWPKE